MEAMMASMSTDNPFDQTYKAVKELERAEKQNNPAALKKFDFSVIPTCSRCTKPCFDMAARDFAPKQCGRCHAVIYCGRACQVAEWKASLHPRAPSHKELCPKNAEHMKRLPFFNSIIKSFPWGRIESDGTTSQDVLKARYGVLGSELEFGYWAVPGGRKPHDDSAMAVTAIPGRSKGQRLAKSAEGNYLHGQVMLTQKWPTDTEGWKLKNESFIPRLFFTDAYPAPSRPDSAAVVAWHSWYKWRGLPLESPAAAMMDYPLTMYHLLVNVLKVVDPTSTATKRQRLVLHYIGAEVELNFLPLFSELALLLPNTDITMVVFGKAGHDLVHQARRDYPGSLATKDIVWSYTAPKETGGGSIAIKLFSGDENWSRMVLDKEFPDALIGLNAGLLVYKTWIEPILSGCMLEIPFGITDYAEQSLQTTAQAIPTIRRNYAPDITQPGSRPYNNLVKDREYAIEPNPFHRPGQRNLAAVRMPNHYNGFTMAL